MTKTLSITPFGNIILIQVIDVEGEHTGVIAIQQKDFKTVSYLSGIYYDSEDYDGGNPDSFVEYLLKHDIVAERIFLEAMGI